MLTSLEIENFKGIAARQRVEFAPLTLLFGANSAGKSSILQALLYLHELIERGAADVDRTELGGNPLCQEELSRDPGATSARICSQTSWGVNRIRSDGKGLLS